MGKSPTIPRQPLLPVVVVIGLLGLLASLAHINKPYTTSYPYSDEQRKGFTIEVTSDAPVTLIQVEIKGDFQLSKSYPHEFWKSPQLPRAKFLDLGIYNPSQPGTFTVHATVKDSGHEVMCAIYRTGAKDPFKNNFGTIGPRDKLKTATCTFRTPS